MGPGSSQLPNGSPCTPEDVAFNTGTCLRNVGANILPSLYFVVVSSYLCPCPSLGSHRYFFFLTGTQFIGSRLEYTRSIDTRASPGKICQCEVQYIVFILVHNKTLQETSSSEYQKKLSTSVVGLTIIRLPGNFLNLKDLVFMISILTWSSL